MKIFPSEDDRIAQKIRMSIYTGKNERTMSRKKSAAGMGVSEGCVRTKETEMDECIRYMKESCASRWDDVMVIGEKCTSSV